MPAADKKNESHAIFVGREADTKFGLALSPDSPRPAFQPHHFAAANFPVVENLQRNVSAPLAEVLASSWGLI